MDAAFKAKWVKALRGGRFDQCREELSNGIGGYCCIGVGYQVLGRDCDELRVDDPTHHAANSIGLDENVTKTLIAMNDGTSNERPQPFSVIADYIEKNL